MANEIKRISQLTEKPTVEDGDMTILSTSNGTKKFDIGAAITAIKRGMKLDTYDDLVNIVKITDSGITMGEINTMLTAINTAGDHVFFDVSALGTGMYLCTIFCGVGYFRINDLVTGFSATGTWIDSDLLVDKVGQSASGGKHYTVRWDKTNAQMMRLNDAANITTVTTNFGHFGSVNPNYSNPFDDIYPWNGRKLCNISIATYQGLQSGDDITDCVTAWEGDANFSYDDPDGVWVYTPPFYGRSFEIGNYRFFDVTEEPLEDNVYYPAMITGRWHGVDVVVSGTHRNIPTLGQPLANVSVANQHTYAKNYGAKLVDVYELDASTLLFLVEYATWNIQNAIGRGCDSVYVQASLHPDSAVTNGTQLTITGLTAAQLGNFVVGATIDFGTSDGGNQTARRAITEVSTSGSVTTITVDSAVTITTSTFVSIHGIINVADTEIGSHSGYIGTNSRCNAYYRGEVLFANRWQYILGAYRHTGDGNIWLCDKDTTDDYDALNTTVHTDTGIALTQTSGYIKTLAPCAGLCAPIFVTEIGGNNQNPVGDYCYVPALTTGNTILLVGGGAANGVAAGFYAAWDNASSRSYWSSGSRPSLKHP